MSPAVAAALHDLSLAVDAWLSRVPPPPQPVDDSETLAAIAAISAKFHVDNPATVDQAVQS